MARPKDLSEQEVEKAWKQAVAWRKQQEKERDQVKKRRGGSCSMPDAG